MSESTFLRIESAAQSGAFGTNSIPEPTEAQCIAGNYKVGRTQLHGLPIAIEQPRGSYRTGTNTATGKRWSSRMAAHYGYISGTKGNDGDAVDVFVGFYPDSELVFVINQNIAGRFDEHKVMLGFPDEDSARRAYLDSYERNWQGLGSIVPASIAQLKHWLKRGDTRLPLRAADLPTEGLENMTRTVRWDANALPSESTLDHVLYELRYSDAGEGLLMDAVSSEDIAEDAEGALTFDALVSPYAKLERSMELLRGVLERTGETVKPLAMQITEPFRQRGVANVAAIFELSDGQTISIFFHNPDVTPGKMAPTDEVISWKWLLNKKDITIVVAPERGADLNVREVARRIMRLAEKNSPAFQRINAKRAERMSAIQALKAEIVDLEAELTAARHELEVAKVDAEDAAQAVAAVPAEVVAVPSGPPANEDAGSDAEHGSVPVAAGARTVPTEAPAPEPAPSSDDPISTGARTRTFEDYLAEAGGDPYQAANAYFKFELKERVGSVRTVIGDVFLTGSGWKEMKRGMKSDDLKARLTPHIPDILAHGIYLGKSALYKQRSDSFVAFHFFAKTIEVGEVIVTAGVNVGEREKGLYEYTAYGLGHSLQEAWEKRKAPVSPGNEPGSDAFLDGSRATLDSILEETPGDFNIVILEVVDKNTGRRLTDLEDAPAATAGADDESAELVAAALAAVQAHKLARLNVRGGLPYFMFPADGVDAILSDELRAQVEAQLGEPLVEAILPGLEAQTTLVPQSAVQTVAAPDISAAVPELLAAGFRRVQDNDYVRVVEVGDQKLQFNVRETDSGFIVRMTVRFGGGITGAATGLGVAPDAASAVALVNTEAARRKVDKIMEPSDASLATQRGDDDRALFQSVIEGTVPDILAPDLADSLAAAYERNQGDTELVLLFEQAVAAYQSAMLAATSALA
jgi:hypothetical protein